MSAGKLSKYWTLITVFLVAVIVIGGIEIWSKYSQGQLIEISISPTEELQSKIYVSGAVTNPGFYSLKTGDSIADIIQAAGGTASNADLSRLKLHIPESEEGTQPQKININNADVWLLQALPGIADTLAQRIVDYRQQNGPFSNTSELTKVKGIGTATYEKVKHLITVAE